MTSLRHTLHVTVDGNYGFLFLFHVGTHKPDLKNGLLLLLLILWGVTKYLLCWPQMGKQGNDNIKNNMLLNLFTFLQRKGAASGQNLTFKLLLKLLSKITFSFVHNTYKHLLCATSIWRIATIK